jgi:hypothetical protein
MSSGDGSLFIRIRGKSQGPYSTEQLQTFARRGQFSRMHEVSPDGVCWVRASAYPHLFVNDVAVIDVGKKAGAPAGVSDEIGLAPEQPTTTRSGSFKATGSGWYYTCNGAELGPVDFGSLQALVASGKVTAGDVVWTEGMADWAPPHTVPGLVPATAPVAAAVGQVWRDVTSMAAVPTGTAVAPGVEVSLESCRAIAGMRPWMLFLAVVWYILSAVFIVGGLSLSILIGGAQPLGFVVSGIFFAILATLTVSTFSRMGHLLHAKTHGQMELALHAMRRFWLFYGVWIIIDISLIVIITIVILSLGNAALKGVPGLHDLEGFK